ncbi:MAG: DUF1573 domain-containing protein [bacterium]|nr:DUF1573 domain-containing protein [bacterium]
MRQAIIYIATIGVLLAALVGLAQWGQRGTASAAASPSPLTVTPAAFDFGQVSMAAGVVSRRITVSNPGTTPVKVTKLYTSCMCTTARLQTNGRTVGPFGMPGHGVVPRISEVITPGQQATLEVTFNPAAHGPAGVGRVNREVIVETDGGGTLTVAFTAQVTP